LRILLVRPSGARPPGVRQNSSQFDPDAAMFPTGDRSRIDESHTLTRANRA